MQLDLSPLLNALHEVWKPPVTRTLSRIAVHRRQFETWWKFELATHLWDFADENGVGVFVEANDRADITLASMRELHGAFYIDPRGAVGIPIELKTIGTWWGSSPCAIAKALSSGRKSLSQDLQDLSSGRRALKPFGIVSLLITDAEGEPANIEAYAQHAEALAIMHGVRAVMDHPIELPSIPDLPRTHARQLVWAFSDGERTRETSGAAQQEAAG